MLASKPFLLFGAVASTATLENVVCNGKDQISFVMTSDSVPDDATFNVSGCPGGHSSTLDASAISKNGDAHSIEFNPYTACNRTPDPSQASTYSVDLTLSANSGVTIGGQTVHFTATTMALKCTFQDTYSLTSDLGGVTLDGDQLTGDEFTISLTMTRTQSDYTTPETGQVVANNMVYHTIAPADGFSSLSDWRIVPHKITLRQGPAGGTEFDIFKHDMGSCGYSELNWAVEYDETNNLYKFGFKAMVLDISGSGTANYVLTVDVSLCNLASTSSECTGILNQCALLVPCVNGNVNGDTCTCDNGWTGAACDVEVPCVNGSVSGSTCTCDAGWQGAACDTQIPCVNGSLSGNTCTCDAGFQGAACDQVDHNCGNNQQYDPAAGQCVSCHMQTICPSTYLSTQSCFGGPSASCISMCLLNEGLGYLKLYEFVVNNGLFEVNYDSGSGVWYDRGGHLGNVPEEMWSTDQHPVYFSRFGNWWQRPVRFHIDGANNSGKVWIYRLFRTNEPSYHDPIYADLLADGYTLVAEHPDGPMYNANSSYGNFVAYKKLVEVNGILEMSTKEEYWSGGMVFKLDCSETA